MGVPLHHFNCDFTIDVDRKLVFFLLLLILLSFSLHAFLQELVTYVTDKKIIFSQM